MWSTHLKVTVKWALSPTFFLPSIKEPMAFPDLENIRPHMEKIVQECCLAFWGMEWATEYGRSILRLYVDRENGVDLDALTDVTRRVNVFLDEHDPLPGVSYTLEVSSPGLERRLFTPEQCARYVGSAVKVRMSAAVEGRKRFRGRLDAVSPESVQLEGGIVLPFSDIAEIRLVYEGKE